MKKTIFTMFIGATATLMIACGGNGTNGCTDDCTNDTVCMTTDSVCDSVATDTVPNDSAVVE